MIENIEREKEQLKKTSESNIYKIGDEVSTYGKFGIKTFKVDSDGCFKKISSINDENIMQISFINDDTNIKDYTTFFDINIEIEPKTETIPCRVISILDNDNIIVDLYQKNGSKIPKKLKPYYVSILKQLNLFYIGAEFVLLYDKLSNGMKVRIESYNNKNIKADSWYQELFSE